MPYHTGYQPFTVFGCKPTCSCSSLYFSLSTPMTKWWTMLLHCWSPTVFVMIYTVCHMIMQKDFFLSYLKTLVLNPKPIHYLFASCGSLLPHDEKFLFRCSTSFVRICVFSNVPHHYASFQFSVILGQKRTYFSISSENARQLASICEVRGSKLL